MDDDDNDDNDDDYDDDNDDGNDSNSPVRKLKTEFTLARMMSSSDSRMATTEPRLSRMISIIRFTSRMSFN